MKLHRILLPLLFALGVHAQTFVREFPLAENGSVQIKNLYGRVSVTVEKAKDADADAAPTDSNQQAVLTADIAAADLKIININNRLEIVAAPVDVRRRVDLTLVVPAGTRLKIETSDGEVRVDGAVQSAEIKTVTGTIAANVPLDDVRYDFAWTESRPRFLSDVELKKIDEKAAGKFVINGRIGEKENGKRQSADAADTVTEVEPENADAANAENPENRKPKTKNQPPKTVRLNFTTARGIILLNVPPNEVMSDLRERPLTDAAKAIVRSGDSLLTDAIRRASPKYFGDYAKTLPPRKALPNFSTVEKSSRRANSAVKKVLVSVTDANNRAVADLQKSDFEIYESNESREILAVEAATAPFNLVLLLDVSGSVDNYVDFIRKTARSFVNSVNKDDKVALIIFNEDVKTLSTFTVDKNKLSESLDTFDAGGGTAYYDALGYVLAETLRPLKGERTAIVALTDGDDNRSFLPFDSLLGSIQESGALIYPLYVPSGLIAATAANNFKNSVDPLRARYDGLTTKATGEGEKLAQISGGVYYPIQELGDLQKAYFDIAAQLRTAYSITFRSAAAESRGVNDNRASPRLRVKVKRPDSFAKLGSVVEVGGQ